MRPVKRGSAPRTFSAPAQARDPLIDRIGDYCSYCEQVYPSVVEHMLPWEGKHTTLKLDWNNLLLACNTCNLTKSKRQDSKPYNDPVAARSKYLWPDTENTSLALECRPDNRVVVRTGLGPAQGAAVATHHMFGFDTEQASSLRWRRRKSAWTAAEIQKKELLIAPMAKQRSDIGIIASDKGFWSVWRHVFSHDVVMLAELNRSFPGTDKDCFDKTSLAPISRQGGRL